MASVKVAVRVRPMNKREQEIQSPVIVSMTGNVTQLTNTKLPATANESFGRERVKQFAYDYSYWSLNPEDAEYSSQQKVFDDLGQEVVDSAFSGYNACVFAYGQTGSGKTYTMMGSPDNYGLTPRVCENLFARMSSGDSSHCTEISYLEIYNERVRDLLRDKEQPQLNLRVREHPKEGPYVQELSKHIVMSYSDIEELLRQGNENRTTAATNMNDHSSRSHAIFTITFTQAKFNDDIPSEIHSKIHLVDLAGSERADAAGTSGERLKEGGSINKSLVTLGNVISSLADMTNRSGSSQRRSIFIPYRDSVLTWLLKDSLGGNSRTIMIATISPAECHYAETLSTLRYAKRAKKIMNKPIVNEDPNVKLIRELRAENARLRAMLGESAVQDSVTPLMQVAETRERLSRNEEKVQELIEEWADKWQETATILQEHKTLALRKEGSAIVLDSKLPYLFCIDDDVLSTGMILYHLMEGETTIGRDDAALMPDIVLIGRGIEADHCVIRNENGQVNLTPFDNAVCYINNILIHESTKLNQGAIIRLGRSHLFRFNDPSEAARLREEMKLNGESSLGKDMQWTWSSTSMTDSAVGSDHGDWDEYEKLEEKRRQVEQLEADHCLAEARRVSQLAAQQTNIEQLKETGDKLKRLSSCAQEELQTLSVNIAKQRYVAQQETERLISEQTKLKQLTSQLEADHASARLKQLHLRQSSEIEQARLELERNRQMVEWSELEKERQHQLALRQTDLQCAQQHLERVQKVREIEKQTWAVELADMRRLVGDELQVMRQMAGMAPDFQRTCSPTSWASDNDTDDSIIDFESLRLKLDFDGVDGLSGLPDVYFNHSLTKEEHDVSEIFLGSPKDTESDDIVSLCCHLAEKVCGIHTHICELLQHKYSSVLSIDGNPLNDAKGHLKSARQLFEQTQQLLSSKSPKSSLAGKLNEFNRRLSTVEIFVQIDEALISVECELSRHSYIKVIEILDVIQTLISSLDIGLEIESSVLKALRTELRVAREQLIYGLGEDWNQLLRWTLPLEGRQRRPQSASLDVSRSDDDKERLLQVVAAMTHTNILAMRVKTFSERVMAYLIEPVIADCSVMLQTIEEPHRSLICVIYSSTATQHESSLPAEAFQHIVRIFTFLCAAFDGVSVKSDSNSGDKAQSTPIVTKIGKLVSKQLFDRIYNCCILPAIPHGEEDSTASWSSFGTLVSDTENFQRALSTLGVLSTDFSSGNDDGLCESLLDRLNNANVRFANLKSQELRHRAQLLMAEELIDSVHVSNDYPIGNLDQLLAGGFENLDTFVKGCREEAATPNFKLPECQISRSVCSLVSLAYEMLQEALAGSSEAAMQLCNATHCVLELYSESIPSHHQEKVTLLPLVAALHHNNCMFIAHHVVIIDKAFRQKLIPDEEVSAPVGEEYDLEPTLALLVPKMRRLGNDSFSTYIDCKKRQLSKLITEAIGLSCCADDNAASAMKLMQTLFHHFHHLGAVWFNVLSTSVYFRSIGSLLDSAISDIIEAVFTIEEFSVDDCQCLQRVIEYVSNGAVDLFRQNVSAESTTSSPEVTVHEVVPSWLRIRELALLLGAGLQDIDDRWSDGKGPLALYFTGDDVARFLTAAFERTSRRDMLVTRLRKHHNKSCVI